jgi:hypothetical protein
MSASSFVSPPPVDDQVHAGFLRLAPALERHFAFAFRGRTHGDREEAVAEAVAAAFEAYLCLVRRGRDPHAFPSALARYAALHVKDDRHVGGRTTSRDALSRKAQRRGGFRLESLPSSPRTSREDLYGEIGGQRRQDTFEERLQEGRQTPIPDLVALRLDLRAFLGRLTLRDRQMVEFLALGHGPSDAADHFQLSRGRISQLRRKWLRGWEAFQGEEALCR